MIPSPSPRFRFFVTSNELDLLTYFQTDDNFSSFRITNNDHHIHLFYSCRYRSISETAGQGIKNLQQLNAAIDKGPNRCVGLPSDADV